MTQNAKMLIVMLQFVARAFLSGSLFGPLSSSETEFVVFPALLTLIFRQLCSLSSYLSNTNTTGEFS